MLHMWHVVAIFDFFDFLELGWPTNTHFPNSQQLTLVNDLRHHTAQGSTGEWPANHTEPHGTGHSYGVILSTLLTLFQLVSTICGEIIKTIQFFKQSKLGYALSKQVVTEELLKSGFSPWVHSNIAIYNAIDNFNVNT